MPWNVYVEAPVPGVVKEEAILNVAKEPVLGEVFQLRRSPPPVGCVTCEFLAEHRRIAFRVYEVDVNDF